MGNTSLQLEHEVIDEESNQIFLRCGGTIVFMDKDLTFKIKLTSPEFHKPLIKPHVLEVSNYIPQRPSKSFAYHFNTRPSDLVNPFLFWVLSSLKTFSFSKKDALQHVNNGRYFEFIEDAKSLARKAQPFGEIGNKFILNDTYKIYIEFNWPTFIENLVMFIWHIELNSFGLELCRVKETGEVQVLSRIRIETRVKKSKL